jgi:hypothetical protein
MRLVRIENRWLTAFALDMAGKERDAQGLLKGTIGKARGHAARLALVLEYLWWCPDVGRSEPTAVSKRAIDEAIVLMRQYFIPMAERVFGDAALPVEARNARTLADWIVRTKPEMINVSKVRDEARLPGLRDTSRVKDACRFLREAGWLTEPNRLPGRSGRPSGDHAVNPNLWEALSQR